MFSIGSDSLSTIYKRAIRSYIESGISKTEIYDSLKEQVDKQHLRRYLATFLDKRPGKTLRIINRIAGLKLCILVLFGTIGIYDEFDIEVFISLLLLSIIAVKILSYNGAYYLPAIIYCTTAISGIWFITFDEDISLQSKIVLSVILGIVIILLYIVRKSQFKYYNWLTPYKNEDGEYIYENDMLKSS